VLERYIYDPYGKPTVLDADWATDANDASDIGWVYLHQGGRYEGSVGLYHFRNRDYSPTLGRWTQTDPHPSGMYVDGMNAYEYIRSSPTSMVDPSGTQVPVPLPRTYPYIPPGFGSSNPSPIGRPGTPLPYGGPFGGGQLVQPTFDYPETEGEYGIPDPQPYDPNQNPNSKCDKPCAGYVRAYKNVAQAQRAVNADKSLSACAKAQKKYQLAIEMWQGRKRADDCLAFHGLSDGKHGLATLEAAQARNNAYYAMRNACNGEPNGNPYDPNNIMA